MVGHAYREEWTPTNWAMHEPSSRRSRIVEQSYAPAFTGQTERAARPELWLIAVIRTGGRVYRLKKSLKVTLTELDGLVFAEHATLPVSGYGERARDAINAFGESFDMQYRALVEDESCDLSDGALVAREHLRDQVCSVEPE